MHNVDNKNAFERYWRSFLPFWLFPVLVTMIVLVGDFTDRYISFKPAAFVVSVTYFLVSFFLPGRFYFRRELSWSQTLLLYLPGIAIWVAVVILRGVVLFIVGRPL